MIPRRVFWLFDFLILLAAFLAAYVCVPNLAPLYKSGHYLTHTWMTLLSVPHDPAGQQLPPLSELSWIFFAMVPAVIIFMEACGCYRPVLQLSQTRLVLGGLAAPTGALCFTALLLFATKDQGYSRAFLFLFALFSSIGFVAYREILFSYYGYRHARGYYARNVVLIGSHTDVRWLSDYFKTHISEQDYRIHGYLRVSGGNDASVSGVTCLGFVHQLGTMLVHVPIQDVIIAYSGETAESMPLVLRHCDYLGITLRIIPSALFGNGPEYLLTMFHRESLRLPAVVLTPPHLNSEALFVKRLLDVVASSLALVLLSPVFLLIALAIKITTPGLPIFYRWRVVGRNGVEFTGYKFTTMISDSDQLKQNLSDRNEMKGPVFKMKEDPRITPLGRFLRKFSLNELPQLWSVLKGDMSLVGPRPAFRHELERYQFWHKRKLCISPGITCLWQIRGRNEISDFNDWVMMDLEYIDNWSLWLDFKILVQTAWVVFKGSGS